MKRPWNVRLVLLARRYASLWVGVAGLVVVSGCASTTKDSSAGQGVVFAKNVADVHRASLDALAVHGFQVKKEQVNYLEGRRPNKMGLFVGSGGESMRIWLEPEGENQTRVRLQTRHSFIGIAGQKNWDEEVLSELRSLLPH